MSPSPRPRTPPDDGLFRHCSRPGALTRMPTRSSPRSSSNAYSSQAITLENAAWQVFRPLFFSNLPKTRSRHCCSTLLRIACEAYHHLASASIVTHCRRRRPVAEKTHDDSKHLGARFSCLSTRQRKRDRRWACVVTSGALDATPSVESFDLLKFPHTSLKPLAPRLPPLNPPAHQKRSFDQILVCLAARGARKMTPILFSAIFTDQFPRVFPLPSMRCARAEAGALEQHWGP